MPLNFAKIVHRFSMVPMSPIDPTIDNSNLKNLVRILSITALFMAFLCALGVMIYYYIVLRNENIPGIIFVIISSGLTYAINNLGLQSGATLTQNQASITQSQVKDLVSSVVPAGTMPGEKKI